MPDAHTITDHTQRTMTEAESAVSAAADAADERTTSEAVTGPGVWHHHFIDALAEQGWTVARG